MASNSISAKDTGNLLQSTPKLISGVRIKRKLRFKVSSLRKGASCGVLISRLAENSQSDEQGKWPLRDFRESLNTRNKTLPRANRRESTTPHHRKVDQSTRKRKKMQDSKVRGCGGPTKVEPISAESRRLAVLWSWTVKELQAREARKKEAENGQPGDSKALVGAKACSGKRRRPGNLSPLLKFFYLAAEHTVCWSYERVRLWCTLDPERPNAAKWKEVERDAALWARAIRKNKRKHFNARQSYIRIVNRIIMMKSTPLVRKNPNKPKQELHRAVRGGDITRVRMLLEEPEIDIDTSWYGENLLYTAIGGGWEELALWLIDEGIDLSFENYRVHLRRAFPGERTILHSGQILTKERAAPRRMADVYSLDCRTLAAEKGMAAVVDAIDVGLGLQRKRAKTAAAVDMHRYRYGSATSVRSNSSCTSMSEARDRGADSEHVKKWQEDKAVREDPLKQSIYGQSDERQETVTTGRGRHGGDLESHGVNNRTLVARDFATASDEDVALAVLSSNSTGKVVLSSSSVGKDGKWTDDLLPASTSPGPFQPASANRTVQSTSREPKNVLSKQSPSQDVSPVTDSYLYHRRVKRGDMVVAPTDSFSLLKQRILRKFQNPQAESTKSDPATSNKPSTPSRQDQSNANKDGSAFSSGASSGGYSDDGPFSIGSGPGGEFKESSKKEGKVGIAVKGKKGKAPTPVAPLDFNVLNAETNCQSHTSISYRPSTSSACISPELSARISSPLRENKTSLSRRKTNSKTSGGPRLSAFQLPQLSDAVPKMAVVNNNPVAATSWQSRRHHNQASTRHSSDTSLPEYGNFSVTNGASTARTKRAAAVRLSDKNEKTLNTKRYLQKLSMHVNDSEKLIGFGEPVKAPPTRFPKTNNFLHPSVKIRSSRKTG